MDRAQGPRVGVVRAGGWRDRATLNKTDSSSPVRWLPHGQVTLLQLTVTTCLSPGAPRDLTSASGVTAVSPLRDQCFLFPLLLQLPWAACASLTGDGRLGCFHARLLDFCFRGHASVNCRADVFSALGFVAGSGVAGSPRGPGSNVCVRASASPRVRARTCFRWSSSPPSAPALGSVCGLDTTTSICFFVCSPARRSVSSHSLPLFSRLTCLNRVP